MKYTVNIIDIKEYKNMLFYPHTLFVKLGDIVIWENNSELAHTITSDVPMPKDMPFLDSDQIFPGHQWMFNFSKATKGEYPYHCSNYPYMKGKIVIN